MAYSSWLNPDKTSGNGNDTVNVSALSSNTGRNVRSTQMTFKAANCDDVIRTVNQAGKTEFVSIQSTAAVSVSGGTLTLTGTSNSSVLTFTLGSSGSLVLTLPSAYTAAGVSTDNGVAITGDPGASQEYSFSITFSNIAANASFNELTKQVIVTDYAGNTSTCTVTQAANEATLSVSPASVDLPWDASTTASFTVTSNTNWTIE